MIKGSQTVIINERTVLSVIWRGDDVCYSYRSPDPAIDAFKSHAPADREYCGLLMLCNRPENVIASCLVDAARSDVT